MYNLLYAKTIPPLLRLMLEGHSARKAILQTLDNTVTNLVNADRSALFLMDAQDKQLYAQVFSVSKQEDERVMLDHLESTCFEDYLNQLGQKSDEVIHYDGQSVT